MEKKPTVCGLYTRVSSRNQLEGDYSSLETQREKLESFCKSQDQYEVYRVYEDAGYSADTLNRPGLKEMLQDVREGKIKCVMAYKIDRLTRSVKDFHQLTDCFDRCGVKFIAITQSLDTHTPMGRLLRNILLDFAQFEREMTADRTRDKMQQRAAKGMWNGGNVPYGYTNQDKRLTIHPEEGRRVQFMFEHFAVSPSLAGLRLELHRRAWYTRGQRPWGKMALDCILRNPVYCGKVRFNEQRYEGEHEALVSEGLFEKVQAVRRDRTRAISAMDRVFLLRGLLKCGCCQSFMTPHYTQKRHKDGSVYRIPYYRCTKTMHQTNQVCSIKSLNAVYAEQMVIQNLETLSISEALIERSVEELNRNQEESLNPLRQEASTVKSRLDKIEREIERYVLAIGEGSVSVKRLEQEMLKRDQEKQTLRAQHEELQLKMQGHVVRNYESDVVVKNLRSFQDLFHTLPPKEQPEMLRCLVKDVVLYPEKLVINVFELTPIQLGSQERQGWLPKQDSNSG